MGLKAATSIEAGNDTWLTPPGLIAALGDFDLDPCCPAVMPWRTAVNMWSLAGWPGSTVAADGLRAPWRGRVFCNPPYSEPLAWAQRMADHGNGILLVGARGPETKAGRLIHRTGDGFFYLAQRLAFHFEDGRPSAQKWQPSLLAAYGAKNVDALRRLPSLGFDGVLLVRASPDGREG